MLKGAGRRWRGSGGSVRLADGKEACAKKGGRRREAQGRFSAAAGVRVRGWYRGVQKMLGVLAL